MKFCFLLLSCSVMSNSLWSHRLQHARLPCPSPSHGACSNSCTSNWWCHPNISSSVGPFSCLQSFPVFSNLSQSSPGSFLMNQLFTSGGQSIRASVSALPINIQDWFPLRLTGLISLLSVQGTLKSSPAPQFKSINSWMLSLLFGLTLTSIHDYCINHTFDYTDLCWQSDVSAF